MKRKIVAASVLALAVTVGGVAALDGNVSAAAAVQKIAGHFGGKGGLRIDAAGADVAKLFGMTQAELKAELKAGKTLAAIAGEKNVTVQAVIDLETKAMTAELDKQLAAGKLTQADYDKRKAAIVEQVTALVNGTAGKGMGGPGRGGFGGFGGFDGFGAAGADVAKLLGMTEADLKAELEAGKTLAAIAGEKGVKAQAVVDLETKTMTAELDKQLAAGKLTQAEYDKRKAAIVERATALVNGTFPGGDGRHGKGGPGHAAIDEAAIASLLGMTEADLETAQRSGKSLAAIAGEKGVAVQSVTDLVTKSLTAELDQRLADGKLTQAEYDAQKAKLADMAKSIVNGTFAGKGAFGRGGAGGPGLGGGKGGGHGFGGRGGAHGGAGGKGAAGGAAGGNSGGASSGASTSGASA